MIGKIMSDNKIPKSRGKWHGGKGSVQKPVNQDKFSENYDKIFGKKDSCYIPTEEELKKFIT